MGKKPKSKELEKIGKKIEKLTKDYNNKNITNMQYLIYQEKLYNLIKNKHWKELDFGEKTMINTALNVAKMGLKLERNKPKR